MVKVKVCGIKRLQDALMAVNFGADALGFLVGQKHESDDFLTKEAAKEIVCLLPPFCSSVLVTHLEGHEEIGELARFIGVTTIQLHGNSSVQDVKMLKDKFSYIKLYKTIHVISEDSVEEGKKFLPVVDAVLPDTLNIETDQVGGTGLTHDWNVSKRMVMEYEKPLILAGGLGPDNVIEAINFVKPYAVDANSGTKGADGFKDPVKLKQYIERAKSVVI